VVVVAARPARAPPFVDDRRAHDPLAAALPEALRPPGARDAGRARDRASLVGGVPALAPRTLAARHGRGDRARSGPLSHVPPRQAARPPRRAPQHARTRRDHGDRDRGCARPLARTHERPARAGPRRTRARAIGRDDAAFTVRFLDVASRPGGASVRIRLPHRGLHARAQAGARLLHAADPPSRPPHRPRRREESSCRTPAGSASRALRAVVRCVRDAAIRAGPCRSGRGARRPCKGAGLPGRIRGR